MITIYITEWSRQKDWMNATTPDQVEWNDLEVMTHDDLSASSYVRFLPDEALYQWRMVLFDTEAHAYLDDPEDA